MDIPSLFMIPSAVSSGKVHSVFPNSTDADFDFNRDSDATRVNSEGLIERVGYYGSELVVNGSFDTNTNWGFIGTANISNGFAVFPDTTSSYFYQTNIVDLSVKKYKLVYEVIETNAGTLRLSGGNSAFGTVDLNSSVGVHTIDLTSNGTKRHLQFFNATSFVGKIDNVSLKEVTGDRARLNYEIEGGLVNTKPSLLLEPQSTNLVTYSEDFSQSYWAKNKLTVTPNAVISPTGELNASLIQETSYTTSTNSIDLQNAISLSAGTYTLSFYVKNNKGRYLGISFGSSSERVRTNFDFNTNTFKTLNLSGTTTGSASFTTLGDFYRLSVTATFPSTVPVKTTITPLATDTYPFFANQDSDNRSFYMWGVQFEQQSYATSYIPTNGSTQTRAAETCNGAGTSSILPSSDGIFYAEIAALANDGTSRVISLSDGSNTNRIHLLYFSQNNFISANYRVSGSTQAFVNVNLSNALLFHKIAWHFRSGKFKLFIDGSLAGSNSNTTMLGVGVINELAFNEAPSSTPFYGKIRDIRVYNTKEMTDSEVDILLTKITS